MSARAARFERRDAEKSRDFAAVAVVTDDG